MLGSHLTLNRTLATHILLVRLQPQPLPPPHLTVRSRLSDCWYSSPPYFSLVHNHATFGLQKRVVTPFFDAFVESRRRLARGPRRRAWTRAVTGMVCFTFVAMHPFVACIQAYVFR